MAKSKKTMTSHDKQKKGIRARNVAVMALIEAHKDEWNELHMRTRVQEGLSPKTAGPSREEMEARIARQRERLASWEKELRMLS